MGEVWWEFLSFSPHLFAVLQARKSSSTVPTHSHICGDNRALGPRAWPRHPPSLVMPPSIGRARSGDLPRVGENARNTGLEGHLLAKIKELSKQLDQERGVPLPGQVWEEPSQRVIVVANRLPVTPRRSKETGEWIFERSSGGLVSALLGVPSIEITWVGWIGIDVPLDEREELTRLMHQQKPFKCVPG